jgi:NTP pyrophosphatase (non-canonical NTP hydrolase)
MNKSKATDLDSYEIVSNRMNDFNLRLMHYSLGIGTEAAEIQDVLKKSVMYGKELDRIKLVDEVGDTLWYISRLLVLLDSSFEEAMDLNIKKLQARYGDKFTESAAINRNLNKENKIFEKNT